MRRLIVPAVVLAVAACTQPPPAAPKSEPAAPKVEAPVDAKLTVEGAWAAATPEGVAVSAGYMTVSNPTGVQDRITAAAMPKAGVTELHVMEMEGGAMKMRTAQGGVVVPANGKAEFAPGGTHLMFLQLKEPLKVGEKVPVTLTFENAGPMTVDFEVRQRTAAKSSEHAQ